MVHLEFVVPGPPVSYQTGNRAILKAWQATVRAAAAAVWTRAPLAGKLKLLLINFHEGDTPPMDNDNLAKPIPDALNGLVLVDDRQVRYSELIQVGIDAPHGDRRASSVILAALTRGDEFLYVRLEDAPDFLQLPV